MPRLPTKPDSRFGPLKSWAVRMLAGENHPGRRELSNKQVAVMVLALSYEYSNAVSAARETQKELRARVKKQQTRITRLTDAVIALRAENPGAFPGRVYRKQF